jgi:hypothetical protein
MRKTNCASTEDKRVAHKGGEVAGKARKDLQTQGVIECLSHGRNAKWNKTGN